MDVALCLGVDRNQLDFRRADARSALWQAAQGKELAAAFGNAGSSREAEARSRSTSTGAHFLGEWTCPAIECESMRRTCATARNKSSPINEALEFGHEPGRPRGRREGSSSRCKHDLIKTGRKPWAGDFCPQSTRSFNTEAQCCF